MAINIWRKQLRPYVTANKDGVDVDFLKRLFSTRAILTSSDAQLRLQDLVWYDRGCMCWGAPDSLVMQILL
jgi:hypothetical protein